MKLLSGDYEQPESDPGEWYIRATEEKKDETTGKKVIEELKFRIRAIPIEKHREIEKRHGLAKMPRKIDRAGMVSSEFDIEKNEAAVVEKACFALLDSENAEVPVGDEGAARAYTQLLGEPVKAGDVLRLDGRWKPEIKERVLGKQRTLAHWIVEQASRETLKAAEEEEGKETTS